MTGGSDVFGFLFYYKMENLEKKYLELFNYLLGLYPKNVVMNKDGLILVNAIDDLFSYDATEFYGVNIDSFKLSKIVKSYSELFYCEWNDCFSQIISIDN